MKFKLFLIVFLIFSLTVSVVSAIERDGIISSILHDSWISYKENKIEHDTHRPLADIDQIDIAQGSKGMFLTFSETISYVLYRAVLINDQETFDTTWLWAKHHMQRCNLDSVYDWNMRSWISVPPDKKDHLFAWRYTPNITNSGKGGIIVYDWSPSTNGMMWRDGLDVAPDGDELIAGALLLAYTRWKDTNTSVEYKKEAKDIIHDLWEKAVVLWRPGEIVCSRKTKSEWFTYKSPVGLMEVTGNTHSLQISVRNTQYGGIGRVMADSDLTKKNNPVRIVMKGQGAFKVILEDIKKNKFISPPYQVTDENSYHIYTLTIPKSAHTIDLSKIRIVMLDLSNGQFDLKQITFGSSANLPKPRYHLFSNDKNKPWVNVSYYMPFLYRIFSRVDVSHPWDLLVDHAYADMRESLYTTLSNDSHEIMKGKGILMPNWMMYDEFGSIVDLPWAHDGAIDDYMSGWDAFRSWYYIALDKKLNNASQADYFITGKPYRFFKNQLDTYGYIRGGYTIAGDIRNINWVDQDCYGMNGSYLAFFKSAHDSPRTQTILKDILQKYNPEGYWENKQEYYKQNWVWLGLAFYNGLGDDLYQQLYAQLALPNGQTEVNSLSIRPRDDIY